MTLVYMVLGFDLFVIYLVYRVIMYYRGEQKNVWKKEFQEVSEVAIFNEIGDYAENQGYDVVYFKSLFPKMNKDNLGLSSMTMDDLEYKYVHYVHIYGDEGLKVSIYFDVDGLVNLFQTCPYYELYDMNDVERYLATNEDEAVLFNTVKKLI